VHVASRRLSVPTGTKPPCAIQRAPFLLMPFESSRALVRIGYLPYASDRVARTFNDTVIPTSFRGSRSRIISMVTARPPFNSRKR